MRNNRSSGTARNAINSLLSQLAPKTPKASPATVSAATSVAKFLAVTAGLRLENHVPELKGQWMSAPSPFKWGDVSGPGASEENAALMAAAKAKAKSVFVKGNRVMVHLKDLAA
jgi:hypothetical protein